MFAFHSADGRPAFVNNTLPISEEKQIMNATEIQGHWDQIRGKVKEKWGQLTDDDLRIVGGNVEQLVGRIEQKTGEARRSVENFLDDLVASDTPLARAAQSAMNVGQSAVETAKQSFNQVADQAWEGYERADELVRHNPETSMAVLLGLGFVTGLVVGCMIRTSSY
jgi:uncharacterized protein YjbJ (UPF0337 family)